MHADLTAISLFVCLAFTVKSIVDAWSRRRMLAAAASDDVLRAFLEGETRQRRHASLYWGMVAVAVAVAFAAIGVRHVDEIDPLTIAAILGAVGVANLAFYGITRRLA